jgi:hypothetical protein
MFSTPGQQGSGGSAGSSRQRIWRPQMTTVVEAMAPVDHVAGHEGSPREIW